MNVNDAITQVVIYRKKYAERRKALIDYCRLHKDLIPKDANESILRRKLFQYPSDLSDDRLCKLAIAIRNQIPLEVIYV